MRRRSRNRGKPLAVGLVLLTIVTTAASPGAAAARPLCGGASRALTAGAATPTPESESAATGKDLFLQACSTCHGADGAGVAQAQLGFATPVPDFTDCDFASREPDADWIAVAHEGGPTRAFAQMMPAFGDALTDEELQLIMNHVRTFCTDDDWPRGELNLPRPLFTEKAYPEDEAVLTSSVDVEENRSVAGEIVYEQRFGARNQVEIVVPFGYAEQGGGWTGGYLGDVALGVKRALFHSAPSGTILSLTGEFIFPTGAEESGFGGGTTVFEPFLSFGQILPLGAFVHAQTGAEIPFIRSASDEVFGRVALGRTITAGPWGRAFSPMVEVLASRELESDATIHWDLVPQMQVTLNKRQHIMINVGARIPVDQPGSNPRLVVYLLWDWFDGGLFQGW